jgi:Zn-dependent protease
MPEPGGSAVCAKCGSALDAGALSCPACNQLVYAAELEEAAARAKSAEADNRRDAALDAWRQVLAWLPPETNQYKTVAARAEALAAAIEAERAVRERRGMGRWGKLVAQVGIAGALAWKFNAFLVLILTKAKFLLLGLTKLSTLGSMFVSMGVYWTMYGWKFAVGLVLSIYIHEMGHVAMLLRYGIPASAPMFLPGLGAVVILKSHPPTVGQDARVGLAGPLWGLGAAIACLVAAVATGDKFWMALAHSGALLNLFNLLPVWQLDGGRAARALDRKRQVHLLLLMLGMWMWTGVSLYFVLILGLGYKIWSRDHAESNDMGVFAQFAALLVVLGLIGMLGPADGAATSG